ncbi:MAG: hypothetical protein RBR45_13835 [Pseudomonas sp.]|jgi:hypothetical protein|nr:hypothetical protein [Pseudomonas sp.]
MASAIEKTPWQFGQAITFLWAGLVFAGLSLFLDFRLTQQVPAPAALIAFFLIFLLWSVLTLKIADGRNWARITYLILTLLGLPLNLPIVLADFSSNAVLGLVTAASVVFPILGLWLLFTNPGKRSFQHPRP